MIKKGRAVASSAHLLEELRELDHVLDHLLIVGNNTGLKALDGQGEYLK